MGSSSFVNKAHSVGINSFHLEWCPKYRYAVLAGNWLKQVLMESLNATARANSIQIFAVEIAADHLHLFVDLPPSISVSYALQLFKGRSSREIFQKCPSFRGLFHKGHFWSRGKFYRSVSNVSSETIYKYITGHKTKELHDTVGFARNEIQQMSLLAFC